LDIPVLKYVDILIGLSLVMVLVSTVVLALTQTLLNAFFARARHLRRGLSRLIVSVEPALMREHATYLSKLIVRHPLIGQQTMFGPVRWVIDWARQKWAVYKERDAAVLPAVSPGSVVQREELAYLLIEFAAGDGPLMDPAGDGVVPAKIASAQAALAEALRSGGVEDPAATLRAIRLKVVDNERANPEQPANRWRADAVMECATSDFLGKLHASFDNTIARVSDAFTAESTLWVSAVAFVVAVLLQLDSFAIVKRLSVDDAYRETFVTVASKLQEERAVIDNDNASEPARAAQQAANTDARNEARKSLALLGTPAINLLPESLGRPKPTAWPGVLLSWVLLSLGAPFWFDALKNLLRLRSVLAKKDDAERDQRATAQPPTPRSASAAPPGAAADAGGEAGDLTATGAVG
jgi:hypothetical protein